MAWEITLSVGTFLLINLTMLLLGAVGAIIFLAIVVNRGR